MRRFITRDDRPRSVHSPSAYDAHARLIRSLGESELAPPQIATGPRAEMERGTLGRKVRRADFVAGLAAHLVANDPPADLVARAIRQAFAARTPHELAHLQEAGLLDRLSVFGD